MKSPWPLKSLAIILLALLPCALAAQESTTQEGTAQESTAKPKPLPLRLLLKLKEFVDSSAVSGLDRSYVGQPVKPWSAEIRSDINNADLHMTATDHDLEDGSTWTAATHSGPTVSIGAWAGYRGYGLGLSRAIIGSDCKTLSFGATGGSYGVNLRINSYRSGKPEISRKGEDYSDQLEWSTENPLRMRSLFLDAYYMFNRKRFSYAAAYDQSLQQLRSAGSPVAGAMYYHSRVAFADPHNFLLQVLMNDVGKFKFTQASLGAGYAYNWVPARGWLISAMAVPMLTFYNRIPVCTYDLDISEDMKEYHLVQTGEEHINNRVSWNFDTRFAVSYQHNRYYLRAYSHYNHFRYHNSSDHGYTSYWTVYTAFGYRF